MPPVPKVFCQSCTMPIDDVNIRGTEKDGTKNTEYCHYCYANGAFTTPDLSLDQMKEIITTQMAKQNMPKELIAVSLNMLPYMKRWRRR